MRNNKPDEYQECFVQHEPQQVAQKSYEELTVDLSKKFNKQLPPNELRTARRPENMAPRTFHLERPFYLLSDTINEPCIELTSQIDSTKLKLKIVNKANLTLEQYFTKKKFKCIYNRLETYKADSKSFQGRIKHVDSLVDYNWKSFKQLEEEKHRFDKWHDVIDSDFESGNICRVYMNVEEEKQYYLLIENDLNTYGYNNWFFFRLKNRDKGRRRFTIVNFIKKTSFFNQGMLVSIFSTNKNKYEGAKWFKGGEKVTFGSINLPRNHHASQSYYSLSFEYDFQYENDVVYFSLNQPYTYSRLVNYIEKIKKMPKKIDLQVKNIGYSIANNILPSLKFSKPQSQDNEVILILARQHPCQNVGSFIAEQIMNFLVQKNKISDYLMDTYDFVIVPMVNPDGVIHGSSRCNMAGLDLNRQWGDYIIKELTPETIKIKQMIYQITKSQKIKYMIDLHGHGKKLNSFFFSCKDNERQQIRLLSMIMKKIEPRFNYSDCTYGISKDKENTIRSTINNMGIMHSYTLQTSLYGWKNENGQVMHFNEQDYRQLAKSLLQSIFVMEGEPEDTMNQVGYTKQGILNEMRPIIERYSKEQAQVFDDNQILSDSDPQGDRLELKDLMGKCENKLLKKKLQQYNNKSRKNKEKKQKKLQNTNRCFSNKNMRTTCASALGVKSKLSMTNHSFYNKEVSSKLDIRSSNKKISLSDKWKERRKQIEKKKVLVQRQFQKDFLQDLNDKPRNRMNTEVSKVIRPFRAHLPHSTYLKTQMSRVKNPTYRMKSQFKQLQAFQPPTQEELIDNDARKSALQQKFKELKKQSLGVLLTDTLSILKINPSQKQKPHNENKQATRCSVKIKKEHMATEPNLNSNAKVMPSEQSLSPEKDTRRLKKFKQFINGTASKRKSSHLNSVFYYFPVL